VTIWGETDGLLLIRDRFVEIGNVTQALKLTLEGVLRRPGFGGSRDNLNASAKSSFSPCADGMYSWPTLIPQGGAGKFVIEGQL
jgi:hypothetical protein